MKIPNKVVQVPDGKQPIFLKHVESEAFNMPEKDDSVDKQSPYVVLKYFDSSYQCFSDWSAQELKAFSAFIDKLKKVDWQNIKNGHGGFQCKLHKNNLKLQKRTKNINQISEDIKLREMRVSGKARVHGFQIKSAFFLVLLDKNHDLFA